MAKFNTAGTKTAASSPVTSEHIPSGTTYEGAPGFARSARSELFLLAVSNMVGEDAFYEGGKERDSRYASLVRQLAVEGPDWTGRFLHWLRGEGNMRSAPLVGAAEFAKARVDAAEHGHTRQVVDSVMQRADEPGEFLAYWMGTYGRPLPMPVKRGVADAVWRLYDERATLKYDSDAHGWRFGDVVEMVRPTGTLADCSGSKPIKGTWRGDLYEHLIDRRHGRGEEIPAPLLMLRARAELMALPVAERHAVLDAPERLRTAGMTWESLAGWLQGPMDTAAWQAVIPSMGYMACLAEGTPVWLADGTTAPIEEVVARRLPVLSYDKAWDTRLVKYGANQGARDHAVGDLVPTVPSAWLDTGVRPVATVRFASGRTIDATYDHRWMRQRRAGRQAWEWTTTADLKVGDRIPAPLTADYFGDEGDAWDGYFVGAMLGDGGMTSVTPEFHGDPNGGVAAFMREYATKLGCGVTEYPNDRIVRMRFPFKQWKRNPVAEVLRSYGVWGKRCEVKGLPARAFSREFWIGALSGLIDTDGHIRERTNPKGTAHGSVEYATVSRVLADQVSDVLLRMGVTNLVRTKPVRLGTSAIGGCKVQSRHPIHIVEVNRATAVARLASLLDLRIGYKAAALERIATTVGHVQPAQSEMHGYDERVALDRVVSVEDAGEAPTYCVTVDTSDLFVANGVVTGNCLRNLRNFDEAGVPDEVAATVAAKLADPDQVVHSRQLPMRFLSAYRAAPSLRWSYPLEQAMGHSLANIPQVTGRTLILVDTSTSMQAVFSKDGTLMRWDAAALFGIALGSRCTHADVVSFSSARRYYSDPPGSNTREFPLQTAESILRAVGRWKSDGYFLGGGTDTEGALRKHFAGHDRVVILTDEQAERGEVGALLPGGVPLYVWNLAGYKYGQGPSGSGNRHTFGGLTDAAFRMIPLLEAGKSASWPF